MLTFDGTTQTWIAGITIAHVPFVVRTAATSTIIVTTTTFVEKVVTVTGFTDDATQIAPKPVTKVLYKVITTTVQVNCLDLGTPSTNRKFQGREKPGDQHRINEEVIFGQPQATATVYTTTELSTITSEVTETVEKTMTASFGDVKGNFSLKLNSLF